MHHDAAARHVLEVHASAIGLIGPTSAEVHLILTSDRLFSGRAALAQAAELRALAEALSARGIPDDARSLDGASLDVSSGLFTRSSSAAARSRGSITHELAGLDLAPKKAVTVPVALAYAIRA
jgi:hypothetical protein